MMRTGMPHWRSISAANAAVAGFAHRRGGDRRQVIDLERAGERDKALEIGVGELDAVAIKPAGAGDAAAQPAHDLFVEQRQQRRAEPLEDDQAQRVRADIDDGDALGRDRLRCDQALPSARDEPRRTAAQGATASG